MFKRSSPFLTLTTLKFEYQALINAKNVEKLSRFKIWKIFRHEKKVNRELYLHFVLNKWIKANFVLTIKFLNRLKRLIRKTNLELNDEELYRLNLWEEQIFSQIRHIKVLNINLELLDKETTYVKFNECELYSQSETQLVLILHGQLFMTNRRLIIYNSFEEKIVSFFYRKLIQIKLHSYGLEIKTQEGTKLLRIYDQTTLGQTFLNLVEKRIKWLNKKIVRYS